MGNCYSPEYLKKYEVLEEHWTDLEKFPEGSAKQKRDRYARELRNQGWEVKTVTESYADLARCRYYGIEARRLR